MVEIRIREKKGNYFEAALFRLFSNGELSAPFLQRSLFLLVLHLLSLIPPTSSLTIQEDGDKSSVFSVLGKDCLLSREDRIAIGYSQLLYLCCWDVWWCFSVCFYTVYES